MARKKTQPAPKPDTKTDAKADAKARPAPATIEAFTYAPARGFFSPGLRPGDTVKARDAAHQAQLEASPCFTPVRNEPSSEAPPEGVDGGE